MFKFKLIIMLALAGALFACSNDTKRPITVGTISGPETELLKTAQQVLKEKHGLTIKLVEFSDYSIPNAALNDGSIDMNVYQHLPYLEAAKKARGYRLTPIGKTFIYPMGIYSKKIDTMQALLAAKDTPFASNMVAIPNDPSNEARALLLLAHANIIQLKADTGFAPTLKDIIDNPLQLEFLAINAAQLTRVLDDVLLAVINTNYAIPAGLKPEQDALYLEPPTSPYANLIVVREADKDNPQLQLIVEAIHSPEVLEKAEELFAGQAIAARD